MTEEIPKPKIEYTRIKQFIHEGHKYIAEEREGVKGFSKQTLDGTEIGFGIQKVAISETEFYTPLILTPKKEATEDEAIESTSIKDYPYIVEQTFNPDTLKSEFVIYNSETGQWTTAENYQTTKGVEYKPMLIKAITEKQVRLAREPKEYGTTRQLRDEMLAFSREWLDIGEEHRLFAIYTALKSWHYERYHTLNYLRAQGDFGTGKTRYHDVNGNLHYKPCFTTGTVTAPALFRVIDGIKGTVIIDEADLRQSDENNEVIKVINQGFERGRPVWRCDPDNPKDVQFLDVFCPKILATRKPFEDKATESRCITEIMRPTKQKIQSNINDRFWKQVEDLQNKLLMYRLRNFYKINPEAGDMIDLGDLEPRLLQLARPFVSMLVEEPEELERFKTFLREQQENLVEERASTWEGRIVKAVFEFYEKQLGENSLLQVVSIEPIDIVSQAQLKDKEGNLVHPRAISKYAKSLGFGNTTVERGKNGSERHYNIPIEIVLDLAKRYGVTKVTITMQDSQIVTNQAELPFVTISTPSTMYRNDRNNVTEIRPKEKKSFEGFNGIILDRIRNAQKDLKPSERGVPFTSLLRGFSYEGAADKVIEALAYLRQTGSVGEVGADRWVVLE